MVVKNVCNIANFNCTFNVNGESKPLLDYFESIVFPAMIDSNIMRITKKNRQKTAEYFLFDVKLIEVENGEFALVGKHVKRAFLRIERDITPSGGVVPIGEVRNSAPTSTFILLLRNHRVIYFKNDLQGSPDIRSFSSTVSEIVKKFIRGKRNDLINELKEYEFTYNNIKYDNVKDFKENVLDKEYPYSEINIVPIESSDLIEEKFKDIYKINELRLSIYKLNSENQFNNYLKGVSDFATLIGTEKIEQKSKNVQNVHEVKEMITSSGGGKVDYLINASTRNNDTIKLTPKDVSESVPIEYNENDSDVKIINEIYESVKERNEIKKDNSDENIANYESKKGIFNKLINLFN